MLQGFCYHGTNRDNKTRTFSYILECILNRLFLQPLGRWSFVFYIEEESVSNIVSALLLIMTSRRKVTGRRDVYIVVPYYLCISVIPWHTHNIMMSNIICHMLDILTYTQQQSRNHSPLPPMMHPNGWHLSPVVLPTFCASQVKQAEITLWDYRDDVLQWKYCLHCCLFWRKTLRSVAPPQTTSNTALLIFVSPNTLFNKQFSCQWSHNTIVTSQQWHIIDVMYVKKSASVCQIILSWTSRHETMRTSASTFL